MVANKIFLDANKVIDLIEKRKDGFNSESISGYETCVSALSIQILCYIDKYKIPKKELTEAIEDYFDIVDLDRDILELALKGPTNDLEDNIQLHSASQSGCDILLTDDKKLLNMHYFGKVRIVSKL